MDQYFLNKTYLYVWKRKRMSILLLWRKPNIFDYIRPFYPKVNKLAWNPLDSKQLLLVVWLNYYRTVFRVLLDHFWKSFYSKALKQTKSNLHDFFFFTEKFIGKRCFWLQCCHSLHRKYLFRLFVVKNRTQLYVEREIKLSVNPQF